VSRSLLRKEASPGSALLHDVVSKSFPAYKTHQHCSRKNNKKITISCDNVRDQNRVIPPARSLAAAATSSSSDRLATAEYPIPRREGGEKKQKIQQRSSKKKNTVAAASADLLFRGNGCEEKTADQPAATP
jgi:hypothetical protein